MVDDVDEKFYCALGIIPHYLEVLKQLNLRIIVTYETGWCE